MSIRIPLAVLLVLIGLVGCDRPASQPSWEGDSTADKSQPQRAVGTGSVNVQRILVALGLAQQLDERRLAFEKKVQGFQQEKQAALDKKKKEIGEKPTDEQLKELQKLFSESQDAVQRERAQAEKQMTDLNNYATSVLRERAGAPIATIAQKRGLAVVLLEPNPYVVFRGADADITEEVIEAIRLSAPVQGNILLPSPESASGATTGQLAPATGFGTGAKPAIQPPPSLPGSVPAPK